MFLRILKLDLKMKKLTNILLLLFIILATIFLSSGLNNVSVVMNGTDYYFDKADIGDYVIFAESVTNSEEILKTEKSVKNYKYEKCILGFKKSLKYKDELVDTGSNIIFQSIDEIKTNIFDKNNERIIDVSKGEVYISGRTLEKNNISVGEEVIIEVGTIRIKLKIAGKSKDALFGSDFMGITRLLMNDEDYQKIYNSMYSEENKGYRIYYVESDNIEHLEKSLGNATLITVKASKSTIRMCYVMDMIVSFIVLILSISLIIVAILIIKFTMVFTINDEYREIGVMKAIGINNKNIRNICIIKYLCLSLLGAIIGFFLSIPLGNMLIKTTTNNMILGSTNSILTNIIGAIIIVLVIVLFSYIYTRKVKEVSPVDAIRNGQVGERYKSKTLYKLKNSHLKVNLYMAFNDILSAPKKYITIIISLFVFLTLVLGIVMATDTMKSKNLISTFSTDSDVFFMPDDTELIGNMNNMKKEDFEDILKNYEKLFRENGMPCIVRAELQFSKNVEFNGNTFDIRTLQGLNTIESKYKYEDGIAPINDNEVAITHIISKKIGAKIGDIITIGDSNGKQKFIVTAYFQSFNALGEVIRIPNNAVSSFKDLSVIEWYQIDFIDNPSKKEIDMRIEKIKKLINSTDVYDAKGMVAKNLGIVPTMEIVQYLLLSITIIVILLVVLLMELSFVTNEKSQIALLKALGFKNEQIIIWHMYRFVLAGLIAILLSVVLSVPITKLWCDQVFGMMGAQNINYLINPMHIYLIYPGIVFAAVIIISCLAAQTTKRIKSSDTASIE